MASPIEIEEISKYVAKLASLALTLVFIVILSYGWNVTLRVIPFFSLYPLASWAGSFLLSVFAVILALFVASERVRLSRDKMAGARFSWVVVFIVLFAISAMGSINTLFLITQGTTLVKEVVTSTNAKLIALDSVISTKVLTREFEARKQGYEERSSEARNALASFASRASADMQEAQQEFEKRKRLAEAAWEQFKAEYTNPLRVGWGSDSRKRYDELKAYLPELKNPSGLESVAGPSASLANANKVLDALAVGVAAQQRATFAPESIRCTVSGEATTIYARARELSSALQPLPNMPTCTTLRSFIQANDRILNNAQEQQARLLQPSPDEARGVQFKTEAAAQIKSIIEENDKFIQESVDLSFEKARPILEKAWGNYARLYSTLRQITPSNMPLDVPADIADSSVRNAGNIGNVLAILSTRLKEPQTYLIILAALLVDLMLVGVLRRLLETRIGAAPINPFDARGNRPSNPLARQ